MWQWLGMGAAPFDHTVGEPVVGGVGRLWVLGEAALGALIAEARHDRRFGTLVAPQPVQGPA